MKDVYRVRVRRTGRRWGTLLLLAGALLLYGVSFLARGTPDVRSSADLRRGVRVTREEGLPGRGFWAVVLAESTESAVARAEGARFAARGAAGYVWQSGSLCRAVAALYPDEEAAERAAANLARAAGIACSTAQMRAAGVLLRLTATEEQTRALLDADAVLPAVIDRLGEIALAIDEGETDSARAVSALATESARLEEAAAALRSARSGMKAELLPALQSLLDRAAAQTASLAQEKGLARLELSGRVRCLQADLAQRFCAYRDSLAG